MAPPPPRLLPAKAYKPTLLSPPRAAVEMFRSPAAAAAALLRRLGPRVSGGGGGASTHRRFAPPVSTSILSRYSSAPTSSPSPPPPSDAAADGDNRAESGGSGSSLSITVDRSGLYNPPGPNPSSLSRARSHARNGGVWVLGFSHGLRRVYAAEHSHEPSSDSELVKHLKSIIKVSAVIMSLFVIISTVCQCGKCDLVL